MEARLDEAKVLEEQARLYAEDKDYEQAKIQYQYVRAIYTELGKDNKANEIQGAIDILDTKTSQQEKEEVVAAREEEKAADSQNTVSGN